MIHQWTKCSEHNIFDVLPFLLQSSTLVSFNGNIFRHQSQSMTTHLLIPPTCTCSQGIPLIAIPHMHQKSLIRLHNTPTKTAIYMYMSDRKHLWVPLRVRASSFTTHMFLCECCTHASILEFNTREFRLTCRQCITRVYSHTHECLILVCNIVSDASDLHSTVNLHLSGAIALDQLTFYLPKHSPYAKWSHVNAHHMT